MNGIGRIDTVTGIKKNKLKKEHNLGDTISWTSQANGNITSKMGRIVAVLSPNTKYRYLNNLPNTFYETVLREQGFTRDSARAYIKKLHYNDNWIYRFKQVYRLKFDPREGMNRDTYHYLVEVVDDKGNKYLYHPNLNVQY